MQDRERGNRIFKSWSICAAVIAAAYCTMPFRAFALADDRDNFPPIYTMSPKGVNLQTGRLAISQSDLSIGPLSFVRSKDTPSNVMRYKQSGAKEPLGTWSHNHAGGIVWRTKANQSYAAVIIGGAEMEFLPPSAYLPGYKAWNEAAKGWTLEKIGTDFVATNSNGDAFTFQNIPGLPTQPGYPDPNNYALTQVANADGHKISYGYNSDAQPRTIISNRGYALVLDYDSIGLLTAVCGYNRAVTFVSSASTCTGATLKTSYVYTTLSATSHRLASVTDVGNIVTNYTYSGCTTALNKFCNLVATVSLPNSTTAAITNLYGPQPGDEAGSVKADQVRFQTTAAGNVWQYVYEVPPNVDVPLLPNEVRIYKSFLFYPAGEAVEAVYANGIVQSISGPVDYFEYSFNGLTPSIVKEIEGNKIEFVRDYAGNAIQIKRHPKPGSAESVQTTIQTFPDTYMWSVPTICDAASQKLCNKPKTRVDAKGYVSNFDYSEQHGGVTVETAPAPNLGAARPQTRYSYGPRYAIVKDNAGAFVQDTSPVWLLTQKASAFLARPWALVARSRQRKLSPLMNMARQAGRPTTCCCAASWSIRPRMEVRSALATATTGRGTKLPNASRWERVSQHAPDPEMQSSAQALPDNASCLCSIRRFAVSCDRTSAGQ